MRGSRGWLHGSGRKRNRQFLNDLQPSTADELRDGGVVEAGGIVFDGEGVGVAIEGQPPDSVYLARVCQSEGDCLGGRRGITEDHIHSRHRDRIAVG